MKKILLALLMLSCFAGTAFAQDWVLINLTKRPFVDPRDGKVVDITGRHNRPNVDPFVGGGKKYPAIDKSKIVERHEKGLVLLIKTTMTPQEIEKVGGALLTDVQVTQVKKDTFGIVKAESGVTR